MTTSAPAYSCFSLALSSGFEAPGEEPKPLTCWTDQFITYTPVHTGQGIAVCVQEEGGICPLGALGHLGVSTRTSLGTRETSGRIGEGMDFGIAGWAFGMMGLRLTFLFFFFSFFQYF